MLAIISLGTFRGGSRSPPGRAGSRHWRCPSKLVLYYGRRYPAASLDAEDWDRLPNRFGIDPGAQAEMITAIRYAVERELPARQRHVFIVPASV
jgi:RNA polymerase sigma-70 factor (ECF subfamily)